MNFASTAELSKRHTHKYSSPNTSFCRPWRPCYRKESCDYCWGRYRDFIVVQFLFFLDQWGWDWLVTLTFHGFRGTGTEALALLADVRKTLLAKAFRGRRYFAVAAAEPTLRSQNGNAVEWLPHFHIVVSGLVSRHGIKAALGKVPPHLLEGLRVRIWLGKDGYFQSEKDAEDLAGYLLDQNVLPALRIPLPSQGSFRIKPYKMRLITATKGFRTGRPHLLVHIELWRSGHEC